MGVGHGDGGWWVDVMSKQLFSLSNIFKISFFFLLCFEFNLNNDYQRKLLTLRDLGFLQICKCTDCIADIKNV